MYATGSALSGMFGSSSGCLYLCALILGELWVKIGKAKPFRSSRLHLRSILDWVVTNYVNSCSFNFVFKNVFRVLIEATYILSAPPTCALMMYFGTCSTWFSPHWPFICLTSSVICLMPVAPTECSNPMNTSPHIRWDFVVCFQATVLNWLWSLPFWSKTESLTHCRFYWYFGCFCFLCAVNNAVYNFAQFLKSLCRRW